jgi:hypothetical protein
MRIPSHDLLSMDFVIRTVEEKDESSTADFRGAAIEEAVKSKATIGPKPLGLGKILVRKSF